MKHNVFDAEEFLADSFLDDQDLVFEPVKIKKDHNQQSRAQKPKISSHIEDLFQQLSVDMPNFDETIIELEFYKAKVGELEAQLKRATSKENRYSHEMDDLEEQLRTYHTQIEQLTQTASRQKTKLKRLVQLYKNKRIETQQTHQELVSSLQIKIQQFSQQTQILEKKARDYEALLSSLKGTLDGERSAQRGLKKQLEDAQFEMKEHQVYANGLRSEIDLLRRQIQIEENNHASELTNFARKKEREIAEINESLQASRENAKIFHHFFIRFLEETQSLMHKNEALGQSLASQKQEYSRSQSQLFSVQAEKNRLLAEVERQDGVLKQSNSEAMRLNEEVRKRQDQQNVLQRQVETLQRQMTDLQQQKAQGEQTLYKEIQRLEQVLLELGKMSQQKQMMLVRYAKSWKKAAKQMRSKQKQVHLQIQDRQKRYNAHVELLNKSIHQLNVDAELKTSIIRSLEEKVAGQNQAILIWKDSLQAHKNEMENIKKTYEQNSEELKLVKAESEHRRHSITRLEVTLKGHEERQQQQAKELHQARDMVAQLKLQLSKVENMYEECKMRQNKHSTMSLLQGNDEKYRQLAERNRHLRQVNEALLAKSEQMLQENKLLVERLKAFEAKSRGQY